ncbi:RARS [Acanthosepion pharaonis]|uniref:Probable arginine--tRNA ligase, mitochondrial n=1 Tax=Acanthosepion pharaonis TaxID=158019 RepID=A0A812C659_ACAPH|nr:RARS [Sepia pharaonis]
MEYSYCDLCAAKDRKEKYNFHKIHYVVDNGQKIHFANLKAVLAKMKESWVLRTGPHFHIGFGRVLGMSTRKGEVVFMKDILDEAQSIMLQKRRETRTTKDVHDEDAVADILGISSILVQDLKERRNRDYKFNWEKCLNFKADSGVFLQYAHARLNSLQLTCGTQLSNQVDYSLLQEQDAFKLVLHICRYDEVLRDTMQTFEPCIVVQYLFQLAHLSNQAHHELLVKGQPEELAQARLLLFHCTQQVLANGLRLVGVPPLDKM